MKKTFALLLVTFITFNLRAQLSDTKWTGTLNVQGGMDVVFHFSNDTLEVSNPAGGESIETMRYTTTDSVMTLEKLYGNSQCDTSLGKYKYVISGNQMALSLISDNCADRSGAIGTMKLEKKE